MTDRYREADEHFGDEVMSERERTHRRDVQKDARRKGALKNGAKRVGKIAGVGLGVGSAATAVGVEVLHHMDGKPLGSFAGTERASQPFPQPPQSERDRQVADAIERARQSVAAGEPAPQSGVIDVSQEGVTGYVDLDSGDPEATTVVDSTQMGGVPAERESDTGGIEADGSTS